MRTLATEDQAAGSKGCCASIVTAETEASHSRCQVAHAKSSEILMQDVVLRELAIIQHFVDECLRLGKEACK